MSSSNPKKYRYERKYMLTTFKPAEIECWIQRNPACFKMAYPPRAINNIYFDSPNMASFFQNIDGLANRTKVRIRWYGALHGVVEQPVLEYKIKRGLVGAKKSHRLSPFLIEKNSKITGLEDSLSDKQLPAEVQVTFNWIEPALINRYQRKYYESADRKYRITVDYGLEFYRPFRQQNSYLDRYLDQTTTIMELKYSCLNPFVDDRISNFFPFRVTKMSKYVYGLQCLAAS
jgi:hypothetical protein